MNWGAFGKAVANVGGLVAGIGPIFAASTKNTKDDMIVARTVDTLNQIVGVVESVEVFNAALTAPVTGSEKAKASGPMVAQIIIRSMEASGKKLDGDKREKFAAACAAMGGNVADIMDCFKD
jgi:hypothetical protein